MPETDVEATAETRGLIKSPQDFMAGLFLVAFGLFCLWASSNLSGGRGANLGPGSFPRGLSFMLMGVGAIVLVQAFTTVGPKLEAWSIRGPVFVLGAVLLFALTVRPLGLIIAGPLALMVSAFAAKDTRWLPNIIFAVLMTAFCILLFKIALRLPIPVAPWANW
ncbi:tripartite tricarboxylate transporter TctB family protein [Phreatobacter sp. AB_2022a]|uniref:tripartite tricarboxylate transporter TctB family protein n=1 Tax=Phreatobacter sp. AB_2022a TaxID=3003134 RepID=UPI00056DFF9D|nr:tripartite tricarboxylate transporter TctB family protein [Phreatobacter sp. AB_2022a]MCZ0738115.1 tripartite tricarboxylate transporter TctB family protein [Phreatobacter sp. AB_2022a]CEJ15429.1 Tripartite tricarboxylate transporter TctB family protein [bacterium YEK0313]